MHNELQNNKENTAPPEGRQLAVLAAVQEQRQTRHLVTPQATGKPTKHPDNFPTKSLDAGNLQQQDLHQVPDVRKGERERECVEKVPAKGAMTWQHSHEQQRQ